MLRRRISDSPHSLSPGRLACCIPAVLSGLLLATAECRLPAAELRPMSVPRPAWVPRILAVPPEDARPFPVTGTFGLPVPDASTSPDSSPVSDGFSDGPTVLPSPEQRFTRHGHHPATGRLIDRDREQADCFLRRQVNHRLFSENSADDVARPVAGPTLWNGTGESIVFRGASPEDFLVPVASRRSGGGGQLLRVRGEYIDDGGDLRRLRGNLQLTLASRLAFDGSFSHWTRPPVGIDDLWTADANLVYVFGLGTPVRLRMGGGANFLESSAESQLGFNSTWAIDISIRRPWIVSGELDVGTLGDESLFHGRASLNALLGFLEFYAGYDWFEAGSLQMEGQVAGAGLWF